MSHNESAGGGDARNDGGSAVIDRYDADGDNAKVSYRIIDGLINPPDSHTQLVGDTYRGGANDLSYEQLAGQGAIEIVKEPSQSDISITGPPEPVVHDTGEITVLLPNQSRSVELGVWIHDTCETTQENPPQDGELKPPNECAYCDKQGTWSHKGDLSSSQIQMALRARDMWHPAGGVTQEGYTALWDDVKAFVRDYWDAKESEIYNGLTAYALSTWLRPNLTFVPHLMLMGKTTGGKTRLLNTLARVSYRAVVAASATPASMFRMIDAYDVSYFVSEYHGLGPDERRELDNVVRAGQKKGEIVTRAEQSNEGFEPKVFDPFSHIAIATQYTPDDDIVNRCIQVRSSPENRDMPATFDETRAKNIRDRLLHARFRLIDSDEWSNAEQEAYGYLARNDITGRTREKLLSLVTVAILWDKLDEFEPFVEAICDQDREAVADSEDARFVQVLRDLALKEIADTTVLTDKDPFGAVAIPYGDIVERYEAVNGVEKSNSWVGHIRKRLGFEKNRKGNGTVIQDSELGSKLRRLCEEHNLEWVSSDSAGADDLPPNPKGSDSGKRLKTRVKRLIGEKYGQRQTITAEAIANRFDADEATVRDALDTLATESRLLEKRDDDYRSLTGKA